MAEPVYSPRPQPTAPSLELHEEAHSFPPSAPARQSSVPTRDDLEESGYRRLHTQKAITTLSAGLLSTLVIGLSYVAVFASAEIYSTTVAPLAAATVLIVAAILATLYLCMLPGMLSKLATLPILFAVVGGAMIVVLNAGSKAVREGGFVRINLVGVLLSGGVFGGLGLGATICFVLFASKEQWRFEI